VVIDHWNYRLSTVRGFVGHVDLESDRSACRGRVVVVVSVLNVVGSPVTHPLSRTCWLFLFHPELGLGCYSSSSHVESNNYYYDRSFRAWNFTSRENSSLTIKLLFI
jgi:hypothetical protein